MTGFQVYCILMLDGISFTLGLLTVLSICAAFISVICYVIDDQNREESSKALTIAIIAIMIFMVPAVLIPNTKQAALIYVLPKVINKVDTSQIPEKLMKLADKRLDEMIEGK